MKRPFFSIIVPCYNSRATIGRLLTSIVNQFMPYEDIQVVLADDCSTESYQDIVDIYKKRLNIKQVSTDYNCCPGNTRQRGVDNATGEWIIFADHDDQFVTDVFSKVKLDIQKVGCNTYYLTRFYKKDLKGRYIEMPANAGWTHGKFFNLDNYWKKYGLHYIKDLKSHEDVCLTTQLEYLNNTYQDEITCYKIQLFTYVWYENPKSLSNKRYKTPDGKERLFIDTFLCDYIESTAGTAYQQYLLYDKKNPQFVKDEIRYVLLYAYFYSEYGIHMVHQYLPQNYDKIKQYIDLLKTQFNCSIKDVYNYYKYTDKEQYQNIFQMATSQTDLFLPEHGFWEWLTFIDNRQY